MERIYVRDLNREQLTKVFKANASLRDKVSESFYEQEMHYISEQLGYLQPALSDYSIGTNRSYMVIKDSLKFLQALVELESAIPILTVSDLNLYNKTLALSVRFGDEQEGELEEAINELKDIIVNHMQSTLESTYEERNALDYFLCSYYLHELDEDCYVLTVADSYTLYQDTTISFA